MSVLLYLSIRVLHVILAAAWFGVVVFMVFFLTPAVRQAGPAGGQVMGALVRRGFNNVMASIAGTTVLTGVWLYWRFTGGFDPVVMHGHAGLAFGIGGLLGLTALIIGGSIVGRGSKQIVALAGKAAGLPEGPERAAIMQTVGALQRRVSAASRALLVLVGTALILMTLAHYI